MRFWTFLFVAATLHGQSFVYSNDGQGANTVSGFSADPSGKLTTITGSPFATKGNASGVRLSNDFTADRIVVTSAGNHLFASNDSDGSISAFSVDPKTGVLTLVSGSPFQALGVCNAGYSLAVSADGKTLVAATLCGPQLQVYGIGSTGALSPLGGGKLTGCKASAGAAGSLKFTSDSSYVAAADPGCSSIEVFSLTTTGTLQAVSGSPFALSPNAIAANSVEINCANTVVYAAGSPLTATKATIDAFSMSNGVLTHLPGAPYFSGILTSGYVGLPADLQSAALTPNDQYLVLSGWNSTQFSVFQTGPGGSLTPVKGSPFGFGDLSPAQVIPSADGKFIYFAEDTGDPSVLSGVGVLAIDGTGTLTQIAGSPFRNPKASFVGGNNAVAAFPPKVCQAAGPAVRVTPNPIVINGSAGKSTSQTVTIINVGGATLNIKNIQLAGNFSDDITNCLGATIQPGNNCQMTVSYSPTVTSPATGTLTLVDDATDSPQVIPISGTATAGGILVADKSSLTLSATVGGSATPQTVTLSNTGGADLTISNITVKDNVGFGLDLTSCFGTILRAGSGQTCQLIVKFTPQSATTVATTLIITDTGTPNPLNIALTGTGVAALAPAITLNPTSLTFINTVVGMAPGKMKSIVVTNTGNAPLRVTDATLNDQLDYVADASDCINRSPIAVNGTCTLIMQFHPAVVATFPATVTVVSNADGNPASHPTAALSAKGIAPNTCQDSDGDGLCDDWETDGVYVLVGNQFIFINLPAYGADANHKDVFIQADWMEVGPPTVGYHSHKPRLNSMKIATAMYANSPIGGNPDGKTGITLHVDCGSECVMNPKTGELWGDNRSEAVNLTEQQPLASTDGSTNAEYDWGPFDSYSFGFNGSGRKPIFHHVLFAHDQAMNTSSSGISRNADTSVAAFNLGASDLVVSLGSWDAAGLHTDLAEAGTLLHELGHNLTLQHGGNENQGYKPNYLSIMNYSFQTLGLVTGGKQQGLIDYSRFIVPKMDELHLDETIGLNGGSQIANYGTAYFCPNDVQGSVNPHIVPFANAQINWDCDKTGPGGTPTYSKDTGADITGFVELVNKKVTHTGTTLLASQIDWDHLNFKGGAIGGQGTGLVPATTSSVEITAEQASVMVPLTGVSLVGPSLVGLAPGGSLNLTLVLTNTGSNPDSYNFALNSPAGWLSGSGLPASLTLQPGAASMVSVTISAPASATPGTIQRVSVVASSSTGAPVSDSAQIGIVVTATPNPLVLSVASANLGQLSIGQTGGRTANIVVANPGTTAVTLSSVGMTGDFSQTNNCGSSIAAGTSCVLQVSFAPTVAGVRTGSLTLNDSAPGSPHTVQLQGTALAPTVAPQVNAMVNAASSAPGVSPGALFTIYGLNLADGPAGVVSLPLPPNLGGTSLTIGGVPAAMLYADANQINAQIPYEVQPGELGYSLRTSAGLVADGTMQVAAVSPGIFVIPNSTHAAAQNQDLTPNLASSPAPAGGIVVVYFTGQGVLDQTIVTGAASPSSPPANVAATVTATIAGQPATVAFAGMTPGAVGLAQANVVVPVAQADGTPFPPGDYPLTLSVGGVTTGAANISIAAGN